MMDKRWDLFVYEYSGEMCQWYTFNNTYAQENVHSKKESN